MRNPKRIKPFLKKIEKLWLQHPDYRFGQIIHLLASEIGKNIFFPEEKEWEEKIDNLLK